MLSLSRACGITLTALAVSHAALGNPEVKDHEIARYIMLKTSCVLLHLKRINPGERPPRFHAECRNVSNWPDGIIIECAEHDDDRSCGTISEESRFKHLDLLRQPER